ncbi:MAG: hypothetical protein NTZ94_02895 [Verrucomicrobia bacterium]|nr:hypothetical protein [Verrucomicrobiota bacterium]
MKTTEIVKPSIDEVMAEVHQNKDAIAEENEFDLNKLIAKLQLRQEANPRLVRLIPPVSPPLARAL